MTITAEQFAKTMEGVEDFNIESNNPPAPPAAPADNTPPPNTPAPEAIAPPVPAPNTPDTPPAAAPAPFNFDEELVRSTGGAVKSKDELAAILDRAQKLTEFETRVKTYEQENAELKSKVNTSPYANDFTKKLDDLYRNNASESQIQAFMQVQKVSVDELTPMDASSMALQIKHGLTPDEAKTYLNEKYGIDPENPATPLSRAAEIALKVDSTSDREFLKTYKAEVSQIPEDPSIKQQALYEQSEQQRLTQVEPIAKSVIGEVIETAFKGFNINGQDGDKAVKIDLPISEESKKSVAAAVQNYITNFDVQPNEAGKKAVQDFVTNSLWIANGKQWVIEAANQREKQIRAEYNNPSTGNPDRGNTNPDAGQTAKEKREQAIANAVLG